MACRRNPSRIFFNKRICQLILKYLKMDDKELIIEDLEENQLPDENHPNLRDLSDEVLLKIFQYLSTYEILRHIALVCKDFRNISLDSSLVREIFLNPNIDESSHEYICQALSRSRCLHTLTIKGRKDADFWLANAINSSEKMKKLEITHCSQISDVCFETIAEMYADSLEHLNLECTPIATNYAAGQITRLKNLKHLNIFNCRKFESSDLISLAYNCEQLETLNIEEVTHLSEESVITLITQRKSTLKSLYLDGESLSDQTFQHIFLCQKLEELGISFAEEIGTNGVEAISKLHNLRRLKLKKAKRVAADDFITLFANKTLEHLIHLDLSECALINDEVIQTIAIGCPKLQYLILNWCWDIRDQGMEFLIRYSNKIRQLNLLGVVLLTDDFLCEINDHLPELVHLDLEQCPNLTDDYLEQIVSTKVDGKLEIINYYGEKIRRIEVEDDEFDNEKIDENICCEGLKSEKSAI